MVLNIMEEGNPLTAVEVEAVLDCITDQHIEDLGKKRPPEVGGWCRQGYYVGPGVCLAKNLGRCGLLDDKVCKSCKNDNIIKQLNYIFREVFGGKFKAEWRQKREYKKRESKDKQ